MPVFRARIEMQFQSRIGGDALKRRLRLRRKRPRVGALPVRRWHRRLEPEQTDLASVVQRKRLSVDHGCDRRRFRKRQIARAQTRRRKAQYLPLSRSRDKRETTPDKDCKAASKSN